MDNVSHPLTLIMTIKNVESLRALAILLDPKFAAAAGNPITENRIREAMDKIGTVHFARFVIRPAQMELMIITNYDNSFAAYISAFTSAIGEIFDQLLAHTVDGGSLIPVREHEEEFLKYVQDHDASFDQETQQPRPSYCAYPQLKVKDILFLKKKADEGAAPGN